MKIIAHPDVYHDIEYYRSWYESKAKNLGNKFLYEVDAVINRIIESPHTWPWYDRQKNVRKILFHRFPFITVYQFFDETIILIAVVNTRREPNYWKNRLDDF